MRDAAGPASDTLAIVGYADRFSARPGDSVAVMVSAEVPYRAEVVRLISGESARDGSGFREEVVAGDPATEHEGRRQRYPLGSYGLVAPIPPSCRLRHSRDVLRLPDHARSTPPGPAGHGSLAAGASTPPADWSFVAGDAEANTGVPLPASRWVFVAAR